MIPSPARWVQKSWATRSQKPFIRLVRLFIGRIFHGNSDSGEGELNFSMGLILMLLPLPGAFYSIFLFEKYSTLLQWMRGQHSPDPMLATLPEEYFFIVFSMAVTGVVAVWRWDAIFPDRRDFSILAPLPLPLPKIFLANLAAIIVLAVVLTVDVNAGSALLFPLAVGASADSFPFFVSFTGVHACVVILASIFSFFLVFAVVGLLMVGLPFAVFRRVSLYLRGAMIAGFVAMLSTSFAVPPMLSELPRTRIKFLPSVWFLGLCQLMRGKASSALAALGWMSLVVSGATIAAAVLIYVISYRRCFVRIPEKIDISSTSGKQSHSWIFQILDRSLLRTPFQRAGYRFVMKTLFRSEHHGLVFAGFLGFGIVTASQFLVSSLRDNRIETGVLPSPELLALPLILSYCIILGVRFTFEIPTTIQANWTFQFYLDKAHHESVALAQKIMLTFVLPWVFAIVLPAYGYLWGWRVGLLQTLVVTAWAVLLAEIVLLKFRKIPFTCPYPPFQDSAIVFSISYAFGFFLFVSVTSQLEYWALVQPAVLAVLIGFALAAWYFLSRVRSETPEIDKALIFEENSASGFAVLDLSRD